ncbi:MAG: phosphate ABC transporter permease subunit PstC [Bacteroidetes bacterium 4484_276]|nr:MAG: phosphate ABC transporter permease subunit PstC [Bacteroidetes bacterium 4484_276]
MNGEKITKSVLFGSTLLILLISAGIGFSLVKGSIPAFNEFGAGFIFSSEWNPTEGHEKYGALSFIAGTLITSIFALILCIPMAFSVSLFIGEYFRNTKMANILGSIIDLLAGIPSIVYGLWGFYVLRPLIIKLGINEQGFGIITASIILAIMIIPYATSISNEIIQMVSKDLKEAAYALGATRREMIFKVLIPTAGSGIFASYILALGRALGETMAVTMLIGNTNAVPTSLSGTGNTMASVIANQFGEADGLKLSSLIAIGLLLFLITWLVNLIGNFIKNRFV